MFASNIINIINVIKKIVKKTKNMSIIFLIEFNVDEVNLF